MQSSYHDEGVDTPIGIGTDERRMHVRAYNYWVSLLDGRAYPSVEDLDPASLTDFSANSVLLDFTGGVENPTMTYLGSAIRDECNLPAELISASEIPSRSLLSRLTDHYLQIIANCAPIGFEAEFVNHRGNNTMYRGILMPFSSDDDTIDFIYGVINWKEVADAGMIAGLADEVERALQANLPRHSEPIPVWADGPSARDEEPCITPRADVLGVADYGEDLAFEEDDFLPDGTESLGDWLAAARVSAESAVDADQRSRTALYQALSRAYDFALEAEANAEDYAELLADSGIAVQERAPMTPIVKLVFGIDHDKTRLAEYALVLGHAKRTSLAKGEVLPLLNRTAGGLKAIITSERAARRPEPKAAKANLLLDKARQIAPKGIVEMAGSEEFVMLFARRIDGDHVAVIGAVDHDEALMKKALRQIAG
ncbi:MAG: hypothetical protein AABY88_08090 [Pseudomonadota bacterium]